MFVITTCPPRCWKSNMVLYSGIGGMFVTVQSPRSGDIVCGLSWNRSAIVQLALSPSAPPHSFRLLFPAFLLFPPLQVRFSFSVSFYLTFHPALFPFRSHPFSSTSVLAFHSFLSYPSYPFHPLSCFSFFIPSHSLAFPVFPFYPLSIISFLVSHSLYSLCSSVPFSEIG